MNRSESIKELATALAKAQGEMGKAIKDANNPFFKSNYADLESCIDASRSALVKNGLSVAQFVTSTNDGLGINTILMHSSGEFIESTCRVLTVKKDPQGEGSALTYYRRYLYASAIGLMNAQERLKIALKNNMAASGNNQISGNKYIFKLVPLEPKIVIDEKFLEDRFYREETLKKVDRSSIKEAIKQGEAVAGVTIEPVYALRPLVNKG